MKAIPRVLIIDDNENDVLRIRALLEKPEDEVKSIYHNDYGLKIEVATNWEEAMKCFQEAEDRALPYTLVLLDLQLNKGGTTYDDLGFELLEYLVARKLAVGVIVVTDFPKGTNVYKAFGLGATDFVYKKTEGFSSFAQQRILSYFERQGIQILEQRIKLLTPYLELGLAYHLGTYFSQFLQQVLIETEALEVGFRDRWGLDLERDAQDPHVRHLIALDQAAKDAKQGWFQLQSSIRDGDKRSASCDLRRLMREITARTMPCLMLKNAEASQGEGHEINVLSYKDDVSVVLTEVLLGALATIPQPATKRSMMSISIKKHENEKHAEVTLLDQLEKLSEDELRLVNDGKFVEDAIQEKKFGRLWGLSIAQYVAMRGGGRLTVSSDSRGNLIKYKIPLSPS